MTPIDVQDDGQADQTVIAGHRHLDTVSMLRRRQERDDSAERKIGIRHPVAACIQHVTSRERDPYDERQRRKPSRDVKWR